EPSAAPVPRSTLRRRSQGRARVVPDDRAAHDLGHTGDRDLGHDDHHAPDPHLRLTCIRAAAKIRTEEGEREWPPPARHRDSDLTSGSSRNFTRAGSKTPPASTPNGRNSSPSETKPSPPGHPLPRPPDASARMTPHQQRPQGRA